MISFNLEKILKWKRNKGHQNIGASQVAQQVKNPPADAGVTGDATLILSQEDPLEEEMATHFSILAWRSSRTEEPGGLQSMGSQKRQTRLSN